jgi:hypothetical protein
MSIAQGLFQFGGKLYAAWKGEIGDFRLFYSPFNGTSWESEAVHIPGNSSVGPSLASPDNVTLYAIWKGENGDSDQRIFYSTFNGRAWNPQVQIQGVASSMGPSLGVLNGVLYAAWKGEEGDNQIYWSQWNGSGWTAQQLIPNATSSVGPSLAGWDANGLLYAGWMALDGSLHFAQFNGSWSAAPSIPGKPGTSVGPSLAQVGDALYAGWKGEDNDQGIYYATFTNGAWSYQSQIPDVGSSIGPALAAYGSTLYAMWKGEGSDQGLYYASYKGNNSWNGQNPLPGNTGQDYVQPPVAGLNDARNYWIYSNCNPITGLTVTIDVTQDLVFESNVSGGSQGFSFQLNAFSKIASSIIVGWQQFIYNVNTTNSPGATQFNGQFETWPAGPTIDGVKTNGSDLINSDPFPKKNNVPVGQVAVLSTNGVIGVPKGFTMGISLGTDGNANVNTATFSVTDPNSNNGHAYSTTIAPLGYQLDGSLPPALQGTITEADFAPILAFQLVLVGPDGNQVQLSSGAANITYKTTTASSPLTAVSVAPPCIANVTTGEKANSLYGSILAGTGTELAQAFWVGN